MLGDDRDGLNPASFSVPSSSFSLRLRPIPTNVPSGSTSTRSASGKYPALLIWFRLSSAVSAGGS